MKQEHWEIWFVISVISVCILIFLGTILPEKTTIGFTIYGIFVMLNMIACLYVGMMKNDSE